MKTGPDLALSTTLHICYNIDCERFEVFIGALEVTDYKKKNLTKYRLPSTFGSSRQNDFRRLELKNPGFPSGGTQNRKYEKD